MTKCEKADTGMLHVFFKNLNLNDRRLLFYGICIWIRLGLVYLSYKFYKAKWFLYITLIISLLAILLNINKVDKEECVWWSRRFHYMNLWMILCVSAVQLATGNRQQVISLLLLIDVVFGIVYSFYHFNK